jgi:hypothetical protein
MICRNNETNTNTRRLLGIISRTRTVTFHGADHGVDRVPSAGKPPLSQLARYLETIYEAKQDQRKTQVRYHKIHKFVDNIVWLNAPQSIDSLVSFINRVVGCTYGEVSPPAQHVY